MGSTVKQIQEFNNRNGDRVITIIRLVGTSNLTEAFGKLAKLGVTRMCTKCNTDGNHRGGYLGRRNVSKCRACNGTKGLPVRITENLILETRAAMKHAH